MKICRQNSGGTQEQCVVSSKRMLGNYFGISSNLKQVATLAGKLQELTYRKNFLGNVVAIMSPSQEAR